MTIVDIQPTAIDQSVELLTCAEQKLNEAARHIDGTREATRIGRIVQRIANQVKHLRRFQQKEKECM